jgi:hypothetical protein
MCLVAYFLNSLLSNIMISVFHCYDVKIKAKFKLTIYFYFFWLERRPKLCFHSLLIALLNKGISELRCLIIFLPNPPLMKGSTERGMWEVLSGEGTAISLLYSFQSIADFERLSIISTSWYHKSSLHPCALLHRYCIGTIPVKERG